MLIDADGFDQYGVNLSQANTTVLLQAANYSSVVGFSIDNNINGIVPPSGLGMLTARSYQSNIRRPVSSGAINQSQQFKINWTGGLPGTEGWGASFLDAGGNDFLRFIFRANGAITCTSANNLNPGSILGSTAAGIVRALTWQNFEFVYKPNTNGVAPYNGAAEVWLEGVLLLRIIGLSIQTAAAFHFIGWQAIVGGTPGCCIKDWISIDASGALAPNTVPLGPRTTSTRIVNGNGAANAWVIGGGAATRWQAVAKNAPDLTTYVEGDNPGDVQEFTLPASINTIFGVTGVIVKAFAQKTSAGVGTFELSVLSAASVVNSAEITPGTSGVYWSSGAFVFDPATGNPFTPAAYNAIGLRITRVQ